MCNMNKFNFSSPVRGDLLKDTRLQKFVDSFGVKWNSHVLGTPAIQCLYLLQLNLFWLLLAAWRAWSSKSLETVLISSTKTVDWILNRPTSNRSTWSGKIKKFPRLFFVYPRGECICGFAIRTVLFRKSSIWFSGDLAGKWATCYGILTTSSWNTAWWTFPASNVPWVYSVR